MTFAIKTNASVYDIALSVYDEKDEVLKEVTDNDLIFPVYAYSAKIKRFYLIGDYLYDHILSVKVKIPSQNSGYSAKVLIGKEETRRSDFSEATDIATTTYSTSPFKFFNALPIDVCVESTSFSIKDVEIIITVNVEGIS